MEDPQISQVNLITAENLRSILVIFLESQFIPNVIIHFKALIIGKMKFDSSRELY